MVKLSTAVTSIFTQLRHDPQEFAIEFVLPEKAIDELNAAYRRKYGNKVDAEPKKFVASDQSYGSQIMVGGFGFN